MFEKFNDLKKEWKRDLAVLAGAVLVGNAAIDVYQSFSNSALPPTQTLEQTQERITGLMQIDIQKDKDARSGDWKQTASYHRIADAFCGDLKQHDRPTQPHPREEGYMKFEKMRQCMYYGSLKDMETRATELKKLKRMLKSFEA